MRNSAPWREIGIPALGPWDRKLGSEPGKLGSRPQERDLGPQDRTLGSEGGNSALVPEGQKVGSLAPGPGFRP